MNHIMHRSDKTWVAHPHAGLNQVPYGQFLGTSLTTTALLNKLALEFLTIRKIELQELNHQEFRTIIIFEPLGISNIMVSKNQEFCTIRNLKSLGTFHIRNFEVQEYWTIGIMNVGKTAVTNKEIRNNAPAPKNIPKYSFY